MKSSYRLLEEVFNKNKRLKLKNNKKIVISRVRNITKNFAYKEIKNLGKNLILLISQKKQSIFNKNKIYV